MKILVVQEDRKITKFIRSSLEVEGFEVDETYDANEALRLVNSLSFTAVIIEYSAPRIDGLSFISEIRTKKNQTPIIFLSSNPSLDDIVAGLGAGADDFLSKPFAMPELLARIKALQRRTSNERGAKVYFGDLCLDPVSHKAWRSEKEIKMTEKEYELLEYFMRHPKQTVTRNMIADAVWGGGFDRFTNIIDVYVNYLRKKIDRGHGTKLIHTIRGIGYMLTNEK